MKILQITFTLSSGGAERFVVDLSNELSSYPDTEVSLLAIIDDTIDKNRHYLPDLDKRVNYICAGCRNGYSLKSFWQVVKVIYSERPDVVHAHCGSMLLYLPSVLARHSKYVHTLHNLAEKCLSVKGQFTLNKFFYKHFIKPVTISCVCQKSYEKLYENDRATCITNGRSPILKTGKFSQVESEMAHFKSKKSDKIFINVARCNLQKNHTLLFESFANLTQERTDIHLVVIGNGFLESKYMEYEKNPNIHILGEKNNVGDYLYCSDFFILSSIYEGLPISLLEAMSCGVIPVSTPVGGVPDVIKDGVNGYLSKSLEQKDFENTILRALNGNVNKNAVKDSYNENFSMKACASKYFDVYKSLLG